MCNIFLTAEVVQAMEHISLSIFQFQSNTILKYSKKKLNLLFLHTYNHSKISCDMFFIYLSHFHTHHALLFKVYYIMCRIYPPPPRLAEQAPRQIIRGIIIADIQMLRTPQHRFPASVIHITASKSPRSIDFVYGTAQPLANCVTPRNSCAEFFGSQ